MLNSVTNKLLPLVVFSLVLTACGGSGGGGDTGFSNSPDSSNNDTGTALLSWTPPTENTDNSALTDLAGYKIYYGNASGNYTDSITLNGAGLTSYLIENLSADTWYFTMTAFNTANVESTYAGEVSKTIN